jgi:CheY-like chemotaxis protein
MDFKPIPHHWSVLTVSTADRADHPANRTVLLSMLESMLRQTVCVFDCANDGREAVEAAFRRRYALVLMVRL